MIRSFRHKGLRLLFETGSTRGIQAAHAQKPLDVLDLLNPATKPSDMEFADSKLHPLKGQLKGHWAVRISGNWRIVFRFEADNAMDVDYVDYH